MTRDDVSGPDWLGLTETRGLSFDDILGGAGGWVAAGWRQATGQAVCRFFNQVEKLLNRSLPLGADSMIEDLVACRLMLRAGRAFYAQSANADSAQRVGSNRRR